MSFLTIVRMGKLEHRLDLRLGVLDLEDIYSWLWDPVI